MSCINRILLERVEAKDGKTKESVKCINITPTDRYKLIGISGHSAVHDDFCNMWLYDGWNGLMCFDTKSLILRKFDRNYYFEFARRRNHSCVMYKSRLIFFGGHEEQVMSALANENDKYYNDLLQFDIESQTWSLIPQKNRTEVRRNHVALIVGDEMVLCGGVVNYLSTVFEMDLYLFNFVTKKWRRETCEYQPGPRFGHSYVHDRKNESFYIFFGINNHNISKGDIWCYSFKNKVWNEIKTWGDGPCDRGFHGCCVSGHKTYILGGKKIMKNRREVGEVETFLNDLYVLDMNTLGWTRIEYQKRMISPRSNLTIVSHAPNKIICFGGFEGGTNIRKSEIFEIWAPNAFTKRIKEFSDCQIFCKV